MNLSSLNLDALRSVPLGQKVALLSLILVGIGVGFYYYVVEPKEMVIENVRTEVAKLDAEIQTLDIKAKHLQELIAASKQLEIDLAKKRERLPPAEEAVMLLKQLGDVAIRLGLDIKLWKPSDPQLDQKTQLFVTMPTEVEVAGSYHTVASFFDRLAKLPRIINVPTVKMGEPKVDQGRVVTKTTFKLEAYAAAPDPKTPSPAPAQKK